MFPVMFLHRPRVATIFVVIYLTVEQKIEITIKGIFIL